MEELDDSMDDVLASLEMPELEQPSTSKRTPIEENKAMEKEISYNINAVQVNPNQKGNPLLKSINNVPWELNEKIIPDYVVGKNGKDN